MRNLQLIALLLLFYLSSNAQRQDILVDVDWLKNRMLRDDLVLLHIGYEEAYLKEHIPGAIYINSKEYTFSDSTHNFDLPEISALEAMLQQKGISNHTDVVIYTGENWVPLVTRLYFTLDYLGHGERTRILDGGMMTWKGLGNTVTDEVSTPAKGNFKAKPKDQLLADTNFMLQSIDNTQNSIVDCRASVYYTGIEASHNARNGRIPGAKTIPYTSLYQENAQGAYEFLGDTNITSIFSDEGLQPNTPLVLYCHIGMQLTVVYTAAKMLGYQDVKIYDGSFYEWGPDDSLPIELD